MLPTLAVGSVRDRLPWLAIAAVLLGMAWMASRRAVVPRIIRVHEIVVQPQPAPAPVPEVVAEPAPSREPRGVRGGGTTMVVWSERQLEINGQVTDMAAPIAGVDVRGDGTVFAVVGDRLGVLGADGGVAWRALPFGSWEDWSLEIGEVFVDGDWVGVVADRSVALSNDEGRNWRILAIDGESDYPQHAAVIGGTLITTGARYGFEGTDSTIARGRLDGSHQRAIGLEYTEVVGIGHDGEVYTRCAGNTCGDDEYVTEYEQVVRAPDTTLAVRSGALLSLRRGHARVLTRDVPDGFVLTGAFAGGALGIDPTRGVVTWSVGVGWRAMRTPVAQVAGSDRSRAQ
jgi:hypothetical protein